MEIRRVRRRVYSLEPAAFVEVRDHGVLGCRFPTAPNGFHAAVREMIQHSVRGMVDEYVKEGVSAEEWDLAGLKRRLLLEMFVIVDRLPDNNEGEPDFSGRDEVEEMCLEKAREAFDRKLESFGEHAERVLSFIMLTTIDDKWKDHLRELDHLRSSVGLRAWGQKDPLLEYKSEAYEMFSNLLADIQSTFTERFLLLQITAAPPPPQPRRQAPVMTSGPGEPDGRVDSDDLFVGDRPPAPRGALPRQPGIPAQGGGEMTPDGKPIGRNDPCWCGSGKKYKKCHGAS